MPNEPSSFPRFTKKDLEDPDLIRLNSGLSMLFQKLTELYGSAGQVALTAPVSAPAFIVKQTGQPKADELVTFGTAVKYFSPQAIREALIARSFLGVPVQGFPAATYAAGGSTGSSTTSVVAYSIGTLAQVPTTLTVADAGFLFWITTGTGGVAYNHIIEWDGSSWRAAAGEQLGGYFTEYCKLPTEPGWQLADGSVTTYLDILVNKVIAPNSPTILNIPNATQAAYTVRISGATGEWVGLNGAHVVSECTSATITIPFDSNPFSSPITGSPLIEVQTLLPDRRPTTP
jgi:hypothetical protein